MATFHRYADDAPEPSRTIHVTISYQTTAGALAAWSRWISGADDIEHAMTLARRHVDTFKRCMKIMGGDASPYRPRG